MNYLWLHKLLESQYEVQEDLPVMILRPTPTRLRDVL